MDHDPLEETPKFVGPVVDQRGIVRKYRMPVSKAESLLALNDEYAFFTPAALYLHGSFVEGMWVDYMYEMQADVPLYFQKFARPIFRGLATRDRDPSWNHVLWAVTRDYWDSVVNFLCSLSLVDRETQTVVRYGLQELNVLDPLAIDKAGLIREDLPLLPIGVFGVYGNKTKVAYEPGVNPLLDLPKLQFHKPDEDMQVFANAYFSGRNPINEREQFLHKKLTEGNS